MKSSPQSARGFVATRDAAALPRAAVPPFRAGGFPGVAASGLVVT